MSLQGVFKPAESPFFGILEQNRLPSRHEKKAIQELLGEKTAHLAQLKSQVPKRRFGRKPRVPRELRAELAYTRRWLEFHRPLVSPWRQLPAEIMSEIFLFTLEPRGNGNHRYLWHTSTDEDGPWDDDRAGTLLVCEICSAWRAIALKTPGLWNTLSIRLFTTRKARPQWVSTWLERSRSSPVHLQLLWNSEASTSAINWVMGVFARHFHHTAELLINGLHSRHPQIMHANHEAYYPKLTFKPSLASLDAPLLSTLIVRLPQGSVWKWMQAICHAAPRLTYLTTSHSPLDLFPLANVTKLTWARRVPMSQIFQMFENLPPNLTHVNIHVNDADFPSSTKSRLGMKSITNLGLTSHQHLGEFLEQAEFPSVVNLRCNDILTWPSQPFHSFLSRSSCALTVLAFHHCYISAPELVDCLQHSACTALESLTVQRCPLRNAEVFLRYLTYRGPEHPGGNRNLRTIALHDIRAPDGLFADMVESRCLSCGPPGPVRLTEIAFSLVDMVKPRDRSNDWKRLQELERTVKELKIVWPARA
ncbi:hypothetical protein MSAN_01028500 [Mycena sanguinolenta]|uniref:F-box domain-containing protein n=1 Tax=Mycena sanguinolenta TaxID=230812 RepID=A0A8H6YR91_9AGAR|nr:hypothetical protein MSAN_01028500 [Mycena sanguinolenta]